MAKKFRKITSLFLAMCLCASTISMQALAAEDTGTTEVNETTETTETTETIAGVEAEATITTTTTTTTDESGNTTVTIAIEKTAEGSDGAGKEVESTGSSQETTVTDQNNEVIETEKTAETNTVITTETTDESGSTTEVVTEIVTEDTTEVNGDTSQFQETTTTTTTTDAEGNEVGSSWVVDGTEKKEYTEEDTGDEPGQPEVTVDLDLESGETTTGTATTTETTGEINSENGQTTTTTTERTVTAEVSEVETTVEDSDTGLVEDSETVLQGVAPVYDDNDNAVYKSNGKLHDGYGKDGVFDKNYLSSDSKYTDVENWDMPEDADVRYVGTGEHSVYYNARVTVTYKKDADGNPVLDEDGNPVIESITKKDGTPITIDGVPATELPDEITLKPVYDDYNGGRAQSFMLMDKEGNKVYAYCCDMETGAVKGSWYSVSNLEDSDYYASEESEEHIRSIVMNGYWGTSDVPKADGSYEMGSLESIKEKLKAAINSGEMENETIEMTVVVDGQEVVEQKTMLQLIEELTEGEALLATQSAIWSYSNGSIAAQNGKDGVVVIDPDGYKWNHDPSDGNKTWKDGKGNSFDLGTLDDFGSARIDFLYKWLINLETQEESTVIINEKNYVEDMSLTVHDKVADHTANQDDNQDNDVYDTDLNFKLAFVPGENDDLLVQITYTDLDGKLVNVVRRLAGVNAEGQNYENIMPEADGSYVLKGLKLSENEDFEFDLRLEGTQYLEQGVYVYAPVGGRDVSQTFVGVASGERNVDVSVSVTVSFDVDENNHVVAERVWHDESDPATTPSTPEENPQETPPAQTNDQNPPAESPAAEYPLMLLSDEGVPLAELPGAEGAEDELFFIFDEEVPLADVPMTGDASGIWFAVILMAGLGLTVVQLSERKRKNVSF